MRPGYEHVVLQSEPPPPAAHDRGSAASASATRARTSVVDPPPVASVRSRLAQRASGTEEVALHAGQVRAVIDALSNEYVRACTNEIMKRLFAGRGITTVRGGEPQTLSAAAETFMRRDSKPFARDAFAAYIAFGIVPIAFRRPARHGLGPEALAPFVPDPLTYIITTWAEDGQRCYGFYWSDEAARARSYRGYSAYGSATTRGPHGVHDPDVFVYHDLGYDPLLDGTLTSNLAALVPQLRLAAELRALMLVGERISSNPPVLLAYNAQIDALAAKHDQPKTFLAGLTSARQAHAEFEFVRNADAQREFEGDLHRHRALMGAVAAPNEYFGEHSAAVGADRSVAHAAHYAAPATGGRGVDYSGAEMPWEPSRVHRLRVTDTHVQHPLPQTRSDYVAIMTQIKEHVCEVLNVPAGIVTASSSVKAGVETTTDSMHRTVNAYADVLSEMLTRVYRHLFHKEHLRNELRVRAERRRRTADDRAEHLLTEADVFEARRSTDVRLVFDLPPTTNAEALMFMYDRGLMTWPEYREKMRRLNGLPNDDADASLAADPISKADRRLLLLGKLAQPTTTSTSAKPKSSGGGGSSSKKKSSSSSSSNSTKSSSSSTTTSAGTDDSSKRSHAQAAASSAPKRQRRVEKQ